MEAYALADVELDKPVKKPQQIEAVLSSAVPWAELAPLVFVGTSDAMLHCYVPSGGAAGAATSLAFLRWHSSYKKIFHACATFLDSWGVYATLLDSKVTLYTLPLHANPHLDGNASGGNAARDAMVSVDDTKNTVLFAANEDARVVCCLTKQNVLKVYDWTANRVLELRVQHELSTVIATTKLLPPSVLPVQKLLMLGESHVLLLFKKEWCVVNVDSGKVVELTAASSTAASTLINMEAIACATLLPPSPLASRSARNSAAHMPTRMRDAFVAGKYFAIRISIVSTQTNASYSTGDGFKVAVERVLEYNVPPKSAFHHHPFVFLDMLDKLAVYSVASMKEVDSTLPIKALYSGCSTVALPSSSSSASSTLSRELLGRGLPVSFLSISAPFTAQLLRMTPIPTLLKQHVAAGRLEAAVMLVEMCPEEAALNDDEKHALFADYANYLFRERRQFNKSMDYYARARVDVEEVLAQYPRDLLPRVSVVREDFEKSKGKTNQRGTPLVLQGEDLVKSLLALIDYSTKAREALIKADDGWNQQPLHQQRLQLLDTVLLKCLVLISEQPPSSANPQHKKMSYQLFELVRSANWCEVGETEVFLRAHNQYDTLLSFYASKKLHRKALELLEDLERSAAATVVDSKPTGTIKSTNNLRSSADYLERTTLYLKRLGQKKAELVFEFSRRVIYANPVLGLSIFTHRDEEIEDGDSDIDPSLILAHLKSCPVQPKAKPEASSEDETEDSTSSSLPFTDSRFLAIEYITQVILYDRVSVAPRLHDDAVYLLLDAIHAEMQNGSAASSASSRLAPRVSSQRGLLGKLRRKLMEFLECPGSQYHPERMLSRTPLEMVDERAALLSRLGRHHEVLQLYALQLRDAALAEAYCNKCYESKQADSSIYSTLLRLYLRPTRSTSTSNVVPSSSPPKPLWQRSTSIPLPLNNVGVPGGALTASPSEAVSAAINILNKYAERIDVATALDLLPTDVPVAVLANFFRRVLERQVERYRNGQIKMQLAKMENFKVRDKLTSKRKESVTVWSSHCCHVCGKKLGVGTFVRLPQAGGTLTLVHFSCQPAGRVDENIAL